MQWNRMEEMKQNYEFEFRPQQWTEVRNEWVGQRTKHVMNISTQENVDKVIVKCHIMGQLVIHGMHRNWVLYADKITNLETGEVIKNRFPPKFYNLEPRLDGVSGPEPSIRDMVFTYFIRHFEWSQANELTKEYLEKIERMMK